MKDQNLFLLKGVHDVNHKPHPYCITPKHLSTDSMYLTADVIREAEKKHGAHCGMYVSANGKYANHYVDGYSPCRIPYDDHTSDCVAFLQLTRNCKNTEASEVLKSIVDRIDKNLIDGFTLVETDEKFRVEDDNNQDKPK